LAEQAGAVVLPERQVTEVQPLSEGGYLVTSERPGLRRNRKVQQHRVEQVVFSAGVLGTVRLLAAMKENGHLPHISPRLGELTRTNSESINGAGAAKSSDVDYSTGIAISSSIYPDEHTHIEGVRYPAGSNAMSLLSTILVDGGGRLPRPLRFLGQMVRHPRHFLRSFSVRRWSERTVILLVMQSHNNSINLRWRRKGRGVKLRSEQGAGQPNPTYIPLANEAARQAAEIMGGDPSGALNEALLNTPVTAHILGGCVIGADADHGVIDPYQRVYGHPGLHIADGSTISANLGVNPSLTITAQAERAMAFWPNKGDPDQRPALGDHYVSVSPVSPQAPMVPDDAPATLGW
jgi:cholesterol oxidase